MKRYFSDDDENDPQKNYFDPDAEGEEEEEDAQLPEGLVEEIAAAIGKDDVINAMQFDLAQLGLNQSLLRSAIQIASADAKWKLRSTEEKLVVVETVYKRLQKLLDGEEEPEKGSEEDANL